MTIRRAARAVAAGVALSLIVDIAIAWLADQFENALFDAPRSDP